MKARELPDLRHEDRRRQERRTGRDRRQSERAAADRRVTWPGRRLSDLLVGSAVLSSLAAADPAAAADAVANGVVVRTGRRSTDVMVVQQRPALAAPLRFGTEVKALDWARGRGLEFGFGVIWTGAWNHHHGWNGVRDQLRQARAQGVTPVVHWWYWGDEISPAAIENGVRDKRHGVHKDRQSWTRMATQLADVMKKEMRGREALVVLETEFNKQGMQSYEPFDALLAEQARLFRSRGIRVVLGFGNWGSSAWARFDRAVAASDMVGTQLLRSSVRETSAQYLRAVDTLLASARGLHQKFAKPVMVMDLAFSSYPSRDYERHQAEVLRTLFTRSAELKAAGVFGIIWRQIMDDPGFDTSNYHGQAERHWGVVRADGSLKPAFAVLREGIRAEKGPVRTASSR